jgi:tetratricopeptide (TPR) repeat protein
MADRGADDCVDCHMRLTPVFDLEGVEIHDHFVQRQPGGPSRIDEIREKRTRDGRVVPFAWPGQPRPAVESDPGLAFMGAFFAKAHQVAAELVDAEPGEIARALPTYHHLRGMLLTSQERYEEAARAYERAIELAPGSPTAAESQINLALVLMRLNRGAEAIAVCDDVLARHPKADGALTNRALVRLSLGDAAGFVADIEAAQRLHPRAINAKGLAEHYRRLGDTSQADYWQAEAERLGP